MKTIKCVAYLFLCTIVFYMSSCTKMNDYEKYMPTGEIKYTGKVDSTVVHSGNGRVKLTMMMGSDPTRTKIRMYWNNRADSSEMSFQPTAKMDTINMFVNNLAQGSYIFNIYSYDDHGNSSVMSQASGIVYDGSYNSRLSNRVLNLNLSDDGQKVVLNWSVANAGEIGIGIIYTDNAGVVHKTIVPKEESVTQIQDYKPGSILSYKSLYLPDPAAIDTFSINYSIVTLPLFERKLDKALFREMALPTDVGTGFGWLMPRLWNDQISPADPNSFATNGGAGVNRWFTFDLGVTTTLSQYRVWQTQDRIYTDQNALTWEIWGSDNPPADGSFTNWTKLMDCQSIKPSGLPLGNNSQEDIDFAKAGQNFIFPVGLQPVRYIRIKVLSTYRDQSFMTFGEISFWTHDR